jgi:hypothetical protein
MKKDTRKGAKRGGRPRKKTEVFDFGALKWGTAAHARQSIAHLMAAFSRDEISEGVLRVLTYSARALLPFWEFERDSRIEERLAEVERMLDSILKGERIVKTENRRIA